MRGTVNPKVGIILEVVQGRFRFVCFLFLAAVCKNLYATVDRVNYANGLVERSQRCNLQLLETING